MCDTDATAPPSKLQNISLSLPVLRCFTLNGDNVSSNSLSSRDVLPPPPVNTSMTVSYDGTRPSIGDCHGGSDSEEQSPRKYAYIPLLLNPLSMETENEPTAASILMELGQRRHATLDARYERSEPKHHVNPTTPSPTRTSYSPISVSSGSPGGKSLSSPSPRVRRRGTCKTAGCTQISIRYGLCSAHGGRYVCKVDGCEKLVTKEGVCTAHGGRYYCIVEGCTKQRLKSGLCFAHGGVSYCSVPGCSKTRQKRGLCKSHGGVAYCKMEGCGKVSNAKGLCRDHGGVTYCRSPGCHNLTQRGGLCRKHGGFSYCQVKDCNKGSIKGGFCRAHGAADSDPAASSSSSPSPTHATHASVPLYV